MHRVELKGLLYRQQEITNFTKFLMHRVELKVAYKLGKGEDIDPVPNAPCGVERCCEGFLKHAVYKFLMHRVELKERLELSNDIIFL